MKKAIAAHLAKFVAYITQKLKAIHTDELHDQNPKLSLQSQQVGNNLSTAGILQLLLVSAIPYFALKQNNKNSSGK